MSHRRRIPLIAAAALLGLAAVADAPAALAQQYWLPNGPGGTSFNNPNGSLLGTMNEHMLQRHMWQQQYGRPGASGGGAAPRQQAAAGDPSFRLTNRSGVTLNELYVSSSSDGTWGPGRLGQSVLPGGAQFVVRLPMGQCVNDIRVVYANGQAHERRRVNTCALTDMAFP
jgi:hypothetical protein